VTAEAGVTLAEVATLVVDIGPGRFTGLRVGLATVRSLAFALRIPVVGLSTLEILAAGWPGDTEAEGGDEAAATLGWGLHPSLVTAVVDARRGEVFQQVFRVAPGSRPEVSPRGEPVIGRAEDVVAEAEGTLVGDGADHYFEVYRAHGLPVLPGRNPDAGVMLALARSRPARAGIEIEPLYLRDPDVNPNVKLRPRVGVTP
jgi:tRNA threonylcarbamoyladenosine biosynthesis protein TsaB